MAAGLLTGLCVFEAMFDAALSKKERTETAKEAAAARWCKER